MKERGFSRREFIRWSLLGSAALTLAACAPKAEPAKAPEAPEPVEKQEEPKEAPKEKVLLRYQARHGEDQ